MAAEAHRYRFGPLEQRGIVGGLRTGQVAIAGVTLAAVIILLQVSRSALMVLAVLLLILAAAGVCFAPVAGRTVEEWAPVLATWALRGGRRGQRWRSHAPTRGRRVRTRRASRNGDGPDHDRDEPPEEPVALPPQVGGLALLAAPLRGEDVGIIKDTRAKTYTAVLAVRVRSFGLLDQTEQERRLAGWGSVLAGLSRESSPVRRLQWLERTVPSDGDQVARYLQEERDTTVPTGDLERRVLHRTGRVRRRRHARPRAVRRPADRRQEGVAAGQAPGQGRPGRRHAAAARARDARRAARRRRRAGPGRAASADARAGRSAMPTTPTAAPSETGWPQSRP